MNGPTSGSWAGGPVGTLQLAALRRLYDAGEARPCDVVQVVFDRVRARGEDAVWITLVDREQALAAAEALEHRWAGQQLPPLYGVPFAVKDNVDVAGMPTTAGCPDFATTATDTAPLVQLLLDAGALLVGKTDLDQFATGLSGSRSPYGVVTSPFDERRISGGSSSGSAVAVSAGLVSFAVGTDTAGSGRVPASLTGTVGVKPSRGLVSTRGVVPACRSLDCPSVFSLSVADGAAVLSVLARYDDEDPYSRVLPPVSPVPAALPARVRVGLPAALEFADADAAAAWEVAASRLAALGAEVVDVDLSPFLAAGRLLYDGPWVAERWAAVGEFATAHPDSVHPVVAQVLAGADEVSAVDAFHGQHRLAGLARTVERVWRDVDVLLLPTTPAAPTVAEMAADPVGLNAVLGRWTTFANLLDLAAVAVPSVLTAAGLPVGVSVIGPAGADDRLLAFAAAWEHAAALPAAATGHPLLGAPAGPDAEPDPDEVLLTVVGAHMSGLPLHAQLLALGARFHTATPTAATYRLLALPGGPPHRPGLVRVASGGSSVAAETYRLPRAALGDLLVTVPAPLAIGTVELADGTSTLGFVCESLALDTARDVTASGGWRAHLASAT